jgi:acetylornithine deacetylase
MSPEAILARVDKACLDFLAQMVRHKSYSETEGERQLAAFMAE